MMTTKATVWILETLNFSDETERKEGEILSRTLRLSRKHTAYTYIRTAFPRTAPPQSLSRLRRVLPSVGEHAVRCQISAPCGHKQVNMRQHATYSVIFPSQRLFQRQIAFDIGRDQRCECSRGLHRATSTRFAAHTPAGRSSGTSRRSSIANRRYTQVLSSVWCPSRSPMVFSDRPDRRR
jgi:hypothetical protein